MRLTARLLIAGLALLTAGSVAGCSTSAGQAYAHDPRPSSHAAVSSAPASIVPQAATAPASTAAPTPAGPQIVIAGAPRGVKAKAGVLADAATGQVLWAKWANVPRPIASITKVMTAYLVIQAAGSDLNRKIVIPKAVLNYVAKYDAESVGLVPYNVLTVDQLLHALLLASAADAAYTLAATYGPGIPAFVAKMNAAARAMGLTDTQFTSPDGLPYPTETSTYSTPAQLLKLGEMAMQLPEFRSIVDERFYNLTKGPGHKAYWFGNSNELIGYYQGAVGIKTGYTDVAGHCLLFEAVRGGRTLIGVVLDSPPTGPGAGAQDAARILNWGFALKQAS